MIGREIPYTSLMPEFHNTSGKKKFLFLYNGGTIGQVLRIMENGETVLFPPKDDTEFRSVCAPILQRIEDTAGVSIDFEMLTTKDSTNMTPKDWERLIYRVKKAQDEEGYAAVSITHGTDTLAYTSTALALALHGKDPSKSGLRIPVVITGSQTPVHQDGGDGRFNLENLLRVTLEAEKQGVADVLVNFWHRVMLGCRTLKRSEKDFDAFTSPCYPDVGYIDASGVHLRPEFMRKKADADEKLTIAPRFGRGVMALELSPGMEPSLIENLVTSGGVATLIFKSLGEGNVANEGEFDLVPLIEKITQEYATPILITTKFVGGRSGGAHYEVGYLALKAGGIACHDHTDVAVDVKARWLIGNGICSDIEGFRTAMGTSYAGEMTQGA